MTHPLLTHKGSPRTAENIADLESRIRLRLGSRLRGFRLHVQKGGLILHGYSRTYYAKQLAQHAVMAGSELPILANEIEVH